MKLLLLALVVLLGHSVQESDLASALVLLLALATALVYWFQSQSELVLESGLESELQLDSVSELELHWEQEFQWELAQVRSELVQGLTQAQEFESPRVLVQEWE